MEITQGITTAGTPVSSPISATHGANRQSETPASSPSSSRKEQGQKSSIDQLGVEEAAKKTERFVQSLNNDLQFQVDGTTGVTVVKVIDRTTKEIIRQIPSEEMVEIARALDKLSGLLLNNKA